MTHDLATSACGRVCLRSALGRHVMISVAEFIAHAHDNPGLRFGAGWQAAGVLDATGRLRYT
jgi:hypothetical protein